LKFISYGFSNAIANLPDTSVPAADAVQLISISIHGDNSGVSAVSNKNAEVPACCNPHLDALQKIPPGILVFALIST
jgi:hypothetical protein